MVFYHPKFFRKLAIAAFVMSGPMSAAQADDKQDSAVFGKFGQNHGNFAVNAQANANWKAECGSCHIAFEPGLLPTESWRKIMGGLDKHFGADATVTAQVNEEITAFLADNSNNRWAEPTAPLRITETDWFKRRHSARRAFLSASQDPAVKNPANCEVCHSQMEHSHFGIKQR